MKIKLILIALMGFGMYIMTGCTEAESDEFCGDPGISCTDPNASIESCCTATSCYLIYNGTKYPCNGTDCADARDNVINACVASAFNIDHTNLEFMKNSLDDLTKSLLAEARLASGCE